MNISKIIYSSSSSVYNSIGNENYLGNRDLYSSSKLACENMIKNFCKKKNIDFVIARIFNMYGGSDKFSFIHKIQDAIKSKKNIFLNNKGESIRDFIHINDVCKIYKKLIITNGSHTIDVGTGKGIKIFDLANSLSSKLKFKFKESTNEETENSIANNNFIINNLKFRNFVSLESFFKKEAKLSIKSLDNFKIANYKKNNIQKLSDYQKLLNIDINYEKILKRKIPNINLNKKNLIIL